MKHLDHSLVYAGRSALMTVVGLESRFERGDPNTHR